jgi:hypothetical protein
MRTPDFGYRYLSAARAASCRVATRPVSLRRRRPGAGRPRRYLQALVVWRLFALLFNRARTPFVLTLATAIAGG